MFVKSIISTNTKTSRQISQVCLAGGAVTSDQAWQLQSRRWCVQMSSSKNLASLNTVNRVLERSFSTETAAKNCQSYLCMMSR